MPPGYLRTKPVSAQARCQSRGVGDSGGDKDRPKKQRHHEQAYFERLRTNTALRRDDCETCGGLAPATRMCAVLLRPAMLMRLW